MRELLAWIAAKKGLDASQITNVRIEAEPSHEWSEYTSEGLETTVEFTYRGEKKWHHMDEFETCEFLNSLVA